MAVDTYVNTLVEKGYKVALCEQLEDPKKAKGMVKRGIIQLVTPGTMMNEGPNDAKDSNYLTSVVTTKSGFGLATVINLAPFLMVSFVPRFFLNNGILSSYSYTLRLLVCPRLVILALFLIVNEDDKWK